MAKDRLGEVLSAVGGAQRVQKLDDVFDRFYERVGGPQAFADLLYDEFRAAQPGSLTRQRILDVILKTTKALDDKVSSTSLEGMTEDDLRREMLALFAQQGVHVGPQTLGVPCNPAYDPAAGITAGAGPAAAAEPAPGPDLPGGGDEAP